MNPLSTEELINWTPPKVTYLVGNGILLPGSKMIIYGRGGSFKSMLAMDLSSKLATGQRWLGFETHRSRVLNVQEEITQGQYRNRVIKYMAGHHLTYPSNLWWATVPSFKLEGDGLAKLDANMHNLKPEVLVLDPLYRITRLDINKPSDAQILIEKLDRLCVSHNCALVLISHTRKPSNQGVSDWGQELIGASFLFDWADTNLAMELVNNDTIRLRWEKVRHAEVSIPNMLVSLDRDRLVFSATDDVG